MFAQIISEIKRGRLPDNNLLRKRFDAALVKKMGVIKTPYSFWPTDSKINPPAKQLLWAAVLLQDWENFRVVEAIISSELEEKQRASGMYENLQNLQTKTDRLMKEYLVEFTELAPDSSLKQKLTELAVSALSTLS